ncbi:MAG TPA: hypothetical protein VKA50_09005 [Gammaproteobacteria bacterium]|nr:hypothetical protein [Gammaproteobacteria bacterium]
MYDKASIALLGAYAGVALLILSLVLYVFRTGDRRALGRLWCAREELTRTEGIINRAGLILAFAGLLGSVVLRWYG